MKYYQFLDERHKNQNILSRLFQLSTILKKFFAFFFKNTTLFLLWDVICQNFFSLLPICLHPFFLRMMRTEASSSAESLPAEKTKSKKQEEEDNAKLVVKSKKEEDDAQSVDDMFREIIVRKIKD